MLEECVFTQKCVPLEQAYKTYCAFAGVNTSDGERICHSGDGMIFRSRKMFGTEDRRGSAGPLLTVCIVYMYVLTVLAHHFP